MMIEAYRLMSTKCNYPLHLGVTESGTVFRGTIKSTLGIGTLLAEGIGDTIRVSLTSDPIEEIKVAKEKIEEEKVVIKHLGEDFNEDLVRTSQVKISELKASLDDYNVKKEELEKIIKLLSDEFNILKLKFTKLEAKISSDEKTLMQLKEEFNDNEAKFKEIENELNLLKEKTKVENFITKNEEINTIEKEKEDIEKVIKSYRNRLEELNNNKDEAIKSLNETSNELGKFNTALEEKAKVREESLVKIRSKVEDVNNIEEILKNIQNEIKSIEENYILIEKQKEKADKDYEECNLKVNGITGKCTELYKRKVNEKEKLYEVLQEENFLNINEVKENVLNKNKIEELKLEVDNYNNDLAKIKGAIESVSQKINNRKLAKEEWTEIQNKKEEKESQVKELEEVKIEDEVSEEVCEECGRNMVVKYGPHGKFLACPGFPDCRNTKPYYEKIGVSCPKCGKDVVLKKTKKGRKYYGCIDNPECDFMSWQKPSNIRCKQCGGYMVEKGKKLVCADKECGFVMDKEEVK